MHKPTPSSDRNYTIAKVVVAFWKFTCISSNAQGLEIPHLKVETQKQTYYLEDDAKTMNVLVHDINI